MQIYKGQELSMYTPVTLDPVVRPNAPLPEGKISTVLSGLAIVLTIAEKKLL